MSYDPSELDTEEECVWCPGCGNYSILSVLKKVVAELGLEPENTVIVSGIGCGSKLPQYFDSYGFHSLHGRALPVAEGLHLANKDLNVIVVGGDGDGYYEGFNHFAQAFRRNLNITYFVQNNQVFALTKGQSSPTSMKGYKSKSTPYGQIEPPLNPLRTALSMDGTFVARGFAGEPSHLKELMKKAINHRGFGFVDIFQPCVSMNKVNTYNWFKERVYKLSAVGGYDETHKTMAFEKAGEFGEDIPIGLFYKEEREIYRDELPEMKDEAMTDKKISNINISEDMEELV